MRLVSARKKDIRAVVLWGAWGVVTREGSGTDAPGAEDQGKVDCVHVTIAVDITWATNHIVSAISPGARHLTSRVCILTHADTTEDRITVVAVDTTAGISRVVHERAIGNGRTGAALATDAATRGGAVVVDGAITQGLRKKLRPTLKSS